jgi:hypothetical protein
MTNTSSSISYLAAFNNVVSQFIEDLIITFPEEMEFRKFKTGFLLLKKTNPKKLLQVFKFYIKSYKTKIINRDDNFFLITESSNLAQIEDNSISNLLDKLKVYWKPLSDTNKDNIWKYLNTLIILSEKV